MNFKNTQSNLLLFIVPLLLLLGCHKTETSEGVAGNYYAITVQAPLGVDDPTYQWRIIETPETSQLSYSDLMISESRNEITFHPDEAGNYIFGLVVYDADGEETASQTFEFIMEAPPLTKKIPEKVTEEIVISEQLPETQMMGEPQISEVVPVETDAVIPKVPEKEETVAFKSTVRKEVQKVAKTPKTTRGSEIPKVEGRLTIQISSWSKLEEAQAQVEELQELGFDAYIQKAYFEKTDEVWYRVRVGNFFDHEVAKQAASEISTIINKNTWVDHVRVDFKEN